MIGVTFIVDNTSYDYPYNITYLAGLIRYFWDSAEIYFSRTALCEVMNWDRHDPTTDAEVTKLENWLVEKQMLTPNVVSHNRKKLTTLGEKAFPSPSR
jgi:hypothetical protein